MLTIFLPPTVMGLGDLGGELACGGKCPGRAVACVPDAIQQRTRVEPGLIRIDPASRAAAILTLPGRVLLPWPLPVLVHRERRPIDMLWIIAAVLVVILALTLLSFAVHLLFSPWLLVVAIGLLVWLKFRSRRSRR